MGERTYITLQVPEEHYLPVLRFLGSGCTPTRVEELSDELIAAVLAQSRPADVRDWRDDEIDRLGEALHSAEAQEQAAFVGTLQGRIRELEAERNEWRTKAEREQRRYDQLAPLYDALLARTAAPEESTEAAAAPEPTVPAPSVPEATPVEEAAPEPEPPAAEPQAVPLPRPEAAPAAETTPVAQTYEERGKKAAATELVKVAGPVGQFVAACTVPAGPEDYVTAPTLLGLYGEWAKAAGQPQLSARQFGLALGKLGLRKQQSRRYIDGSKPILYFGIKLKTQAPAAPETDAERRKREVAEVRELAKKARANGAREIVVDDQPVAPYIEPKPKPKPGKQPILAVRNADQRPTLRDYSSVRVIKADGAVTYVDAMDWIDPDEDHEPIKPEDADRTTFDLWTDVKNGMRDRPLGFLPDVLALEGVNTDELEATVKDPAHVEIRPETRSKGYPVLGFRRGDVKVIVGFRDQQKPAVIAAYWDALLTPDSHVVYRHGGGGSKKQTGLPTTVKQSVTQLKRRGFEIDAAWEKATQPVEVKYDGQVLGKMKVHLANKQQVQGDFQRLLRQAHAIDRRKGLVSA